MRVRNHQPGIRETWVPRTEDSREVEVEVE